jgi:hypothetical protein
MAGTGLVLHIPALATDMFTAGVALKSGGVIPTTMDSQKLLQQLEQASFIAHENEGQPDPT